MFQRITLLVTVLGFLLITACGGGEREERWTRDGRAKKNAAIEQAKEDALQAQAEAKRMQEEAEKAVKAAQEAAAANGTGEESTEVAEGAAIPDAARTKSKVLSSETAAADISGRWDLEFEVPGAPQKQTMLIKQQAGEASAIIDGQEVAIKLDGNSISFDMPQQTPLGKMTINYKGTVQGDDVLGIFKMPRGPLSGQNLTWSGKRN